MKIAGLCIFLAACIIPAQPRGGGAYGGGGAPSSSSSPSSSSTGDPYGGGSSGGAAAPAGPQTVSVEIRSRCPSTVHVFYGDKPKYGSGTSSTISSNSVESHTFNAGDMLWIIDDSENGVASTSVGPGTREIEISEGCTSLIAR